jgi:hypothetical protein
MLFQEPGILFKKFTIAGQADRQWDLFPVSEAHAKRIGLSKAWLTTIDNVNIIDIGGNETFKLPKLKAGLAYCQLLTILGHLNLRARCIYKKIGSPCGCQQTNRCSNPTV